MSSFNRRTIILGGLAVGGCGFKPVYGGGSSSGPGRLLQSVKVRAEQGEVGFRLQEALIERLRPARADAPLVLVTQTRVTRDGVAIEEDDQITRFNLRLMTRYTLRRKGDAPSSVLSEGQVRSIAAYNATPSQYATLVAERQVFRRASNEIADKIVKRLAVAYDPAWTG